MWPNILEGVSCHWWNITSHLVNDVMVEMWGERMVCHGKGWASILGPTGKLPQDENKTKRAHMAIAYSHVILVICHLSMLVICYSFLSFSLLFMMFVMLFWQQFQNKLVTNSLVLKSMEFLQEFPNHCHQQWQTLSPIRGLPSQLQMLCHPQPPPLTLCNQK